MSDAVGFSFLAGASLGFCLAVVFVAACAASSEKRRIKNGLMEHDGVVYRITRIEA